VGKTKINKVIVFSIPAVVSFLLYFGLQRAEAWILLSVLLAILLGYGIFYFNKLFSALLLLSFSLPLSIEYEIFSGVQMIIPTEFLAIIIAISLAFSALNRLKQIKALIRAHSPFFALALVIFIGSIFSTDFVVSAKYSLVYLLYLFTFTWSVYYVSLKGKEAFIYIIMAYTAGFFLAFFGLFTIGVCMNLTP